MSHYHYAQLLLTGSIRLNPKIGVGNFFPPPHRSQCLQSTPSWHGDRRALATVSRTQSRAPQRMHPVKPAGGLPSR